MLCYDTEDISIRWQVHRKSSVTKRPAGQGGAGQSSSPVPSPHTGRPLTQHPPQDRNSQGQGRGPSKPTRTRNPQAENNTLSIPFFQLSVRKILPTASISNLPVYTFLSAHQYNKARIFFFLKPRQIEVKPPSPDSSPSHQARARVCPLL